MHASVERKVVPKAKEYSGYAGMARKLERRKAVEGVVLWFSGLKLCTTTKRQDDKRKAKYFTRGRSVASKRPR